MPTQNIVFRPSFNSSLEVEARSERLTNNPGAVLLREILDKVGLVPWLCARLSDPRRPELITYPLSELLRTRLLLLAQGYEDQDDADFYHERIYHPLVATLGETGDLLDLKLREGSAHTAQGAKEFVLPLLSRVEAKLGQVAAVRIDAGFPEEEPLSALEHRRTPYVARLRNNPVLDRMAEPHLRRPPGRRPATERRWSIEMTYQAQSWSRPRRVVLVVLDRPSELFLHHFWLVTNWTAEQVNGEQLLMTYRERGTAEGYMGELMNAIRPALSGAPRPKSHYRGEPLGEAALPIDGFAHNEATLLLCGLAYTTPRGCSQRLRRASE
jgi:hypothetical protein